MIVFRVDSSNQLGSGHLMRCLTLAKYLEEKDEIIFISRNLKGNLNYLIKKKYKLFLLSEESLVDQQNNIMFQEIDAMQTIQIIRRMDINCLVVDNYNLDEKWENLIRTCVRKIMTIDDLANRKHNCDILLDQNYEAELYNKYDGLVPLNCKLFLGIKYLLLREEFYKIKRTSIKSKVQKVLCFFGGSDVTNQTEKILKVISLLNYANVEFNIVVGNANIKKDKIRILCEGLYNVKYHCQINYMDKLIAQSDLYIGACGSTIWECYFLKVPSIIISTTKNELDYILSLKKEPPFFYLGWHTDVSMDVLLKYVKDFIDNYASKVKILNRNSEIISDKNRIGELISTLQS